ncbi:hypothetical protein Q7P35_009597 [Cladosporium inversicolor]
MQVQQNLVPSLVYLRWRRPSIADLASQPEPRHLSSLAHAITIKRTEPMRQISLNTWNAARRIPLFVWRKRTRARELWQGNYHACRATVPWYGHFVPLWQQAKSTVDYDRRGAGVGSDIFTQATVGGKRGNWKVLGPALLWRGMEQLTSRSLLEFEESCELMCCKVSCGEPAMVTPLELRIGPGVLGQRLIAIGYQAKDYEPVSRDGDMGGGATGASNVWRTGMRPLGD